MQYRLRLNLDGVTSYHPLTRTAHGKYIGDFALPDGRLVKAVIHPGRTSAEGTIQVDGQTIGLPSQRFRTTESGPIANWPATGSVNAIQTMGVGLVAADADPTPEIQAIQGTGCCSGSTQTTKMVVSINFRPTASSQFMLRFFISGGNGRWTGRFVDDFDFGTAQSCGQHKLLGIQKVAARIDLECVDGPTPSLIGKVDVTIAKTFNRCTLPPTFLDCVNGGPTCLAEWPSLFFGPYLGAGTVSIRGVVPQTKNRI